MRSNCHLCYRTSYWYCFGNASLKRVTNSLVPIEGSQHNALRSTSDDPSNINQFLSIPSAKPTMLSNVASWGSTCSLHDELAAELENFCTMASTSPLAAIKNETRFWPAKPALTWLRWPPHCYQWSASLRSSSPSRALTSPSFFVSPHWTKNCMSCVPEMRFGKQCVNNFGTCHHMLCIGLTHATWPKEVSFFVKAYLIIVDFWFDFPGCYKTVAFTAKSLEKSTRNNVKFWNPDEEVHSMNKWSQTAQNSFWTYRFMRADTLKKNVWNTFPWIVVGLDSWAWSKQVVTAYKSCCKKVVDGDCLGLFYVDTRNGAPSPRVIFYTFAGL